MALTKEVRDMLDDLDLVMDSDEVNCACCRYSYHNGGDCIPSLTTEKSPCEEQDIEDCIYPKLVREQYEQLRDEIEAKKEESTNGDYD